MVSERKLAERLILQEFRCVIDFLMHNTGLISNFCNQSVIGSCNSHFIPIIICRKFIKPLALFVLMTVFTFGLKSQNCQNPSLSKDHAKIKRLIDVLESAHALAYADTVIQIIDKENLSECEITYWIRFERGETLELNQRFDEALDEYYKIVLMAEKKKWWKLLAYTHISMARVYEAIDMLPDCGRNLKDAKLLIDKHSLDSIYPWYCTRTSSFHRFNQNIDSARIYAFRSVNIGKKYNQVRPVTDGFLLLGVTADDLDTSVYYLRQSIQSFRDQDVPLGAASQSLNVVNRLLNAERYSDAKSELMTAQSLIALSSDRSKMYFRFKSHYHNLSKNLYDKIGIKDSAYLHSQLAYENLIKSNYEVDYYKVNKNSIDFVIKKENEKTQNLRTISKLIAVGLFLSLISILALYLMYRSNSKKNKVISERNNIIQHQNKLLEKSLEKQSTLLSEVHHRVKNNLQLVISMLSLKAKNLNSSELRLHMDDISTKVRGIALIHEQLYSSGEFENIDIHSYLYELLSHFSNLQDTTNPFDIDFDIEHLQLNIDTVMPLGIICTELIGNSLKYARQDHKTLQLHIEISSQIDHYEFHYSDNGPGFTDQSDKLQKSGIGMKLIKSMVRQLDGKSEFISENGIHFRMTFKEKQISKI
jgi:two-component sensor histidine kinase